MPKATYVRDDRAPRHGTSETAAERDTRFARERALLDEARAEFATGPTMDDNEVEGWLDALDGDEDLPLPEVRHRSRPTLKD